jgi:hypothetical protein
MNMLKISGIYQLVIGLGMVGIWILHFLNGEVPELQTEPIRIAMHLLAEVATGTILLVSGCFILFKGRKKSLLFNLSFGALLYSLIASPGYFAQMGQWGVTGMFLLLLATTVALLMVQDQPDKKDF